MRTSRIALILAALAALGPFSVDTYFPSFPSIARHFQVTELEVQSTLTFYLLALAAMNLFHGSLSDAFGRRRVILAALAVFTVTAFACVGAPAFRWLLAFRIVQGLAGGAGMIVGRAIIRDRFDGSEAHRFMAQVTMVSGLAPAVAPILGGWLHVWLGWRGPFLFLGLLGSLMFTVCYLWLPESLSEGARQSFHPVKLFQGYWQVSSNAAFLALSFALSMGGGGFLLYVATAPDVVLNILNLSETRFGWVFLPLVSGLIGGSALTARIAGRVPSRKILAWGFGLMTAGAGLNLAYNALFTPAIPWAVVPLVVYTFGFALFAPVGTILCLDLFPQRKGMASSLQGSVQTLVFALISWGVAGWVYRSGFKHALAMGVMLVLNVAGWTTYKALKSSR